MKQLKSVKIVYAIARYCRANSNNNKQQQKHDGKSVRQQAPDAEERAKTGRCYVHRFDLPVASRLA